MLANLFISSEFNASLDINKQADTVIEWHNNANNREAWVRGVLNDMTHNVAQKRGENVMVFNLSQPHEVNFQDVSMYKNVYKYGTTYGIWIFKSGKFENKGDGGYINWAFSGLYNQNGKTIEFHSS